MPEHTDLGGSTMVEKIETLAVTERTIPGSYDELWKLGGHFAKSFMVPAHFQDKPEAVFTVLVMARDMGINPIQALNNIYVVSGKPGLSSVLLIALANRAKIFKGSISYKVEGSGETLKVTASAILSSDGKTQSETVSMAMATADGWTKNAKYRSMPEHMLKYRAATFLIRRHHPEILFGLPNVEELHDVHGEDINTEKIAVKYDANELLE